MCLKESNVDMDVNGDAGVDEKDNDGDDDDDDFGSVIAILLLLQSACSKLYIMLQVHS